MPGRLVLCSSPIGNLGDVSDRLREELAGADVVYAEDTRRSKTLLSRLGIERPLRSYFAGNEHERASEIARRLSDGATVALLTDAGTPSVSDPGVSAVRAALEADAVVTVVPGPSAVTAALAVSGLATDRFVFEGFLPRKGADRALRLRELGGESRTIVVFSAPSRVAADLTDLAAALGHDRAVAVARELTKLHEEVWRGTIAEAARRWSEEVQPRGEFTVVIEGASMAAPDLSAAVDEVLAELERGTSLTDAVRKVADMTGTRKRRLYEAALLRRGSR